MSPPRRAIVSQAVPTASKVVAEKRIAGKTFKLEGGGSVMAPGAGDALVLSYYKPAKAVTVARAEHAGRL